LAGEYKPSPFYTKDVAMDREILKYELEYTLEDGTEGLIFITISKITNEIRDKMWEIINEQNKIQELVFKMEAIKEGIAISLLKPSQIDPNDPEKDLKLEENRKELEEYSKQIKDITKTILAYNNEKFYKKRFDILKKVFIKNGITDERVLSYDFWNENTDAAEAARLFEFLYFKDVKKNNRASIEMLNVTSLN
jgi:hypothetical protein